MSDLGKTNPLTAENKNLPKMTHYLPKKEFDRWLKAQNKRSVYAEDIKRHLDKDALKKETGLTKLTGVSLVLVDEDGMAKGLKENRTLRYNKEYRAMWGDKPLYGNAVVILSDKAYEELAPEKKETPTEYVAFEGREWRTPENLAKLKAQKEAEDAKEVEELKARLVKLKKEEEELKARLATKGAGSGEA